MKTLAEMSLQELWQLFPIQLVAPRPGWTAQYAEEEKLLRPLLPAGARLYHIGSTSVQTIWAKPIVDILVTSGNTDGAENGILRAGYVCMHRENHRRDYCKGYTVEGFAEKVFHLHLRLPGDCPELYFRDWLLEHPETAKEYEQLKLSLWKPFEHDRDGYTDAKGAFVREVTEKAMRLYAGKYEKRDL